MAGGVDHDFVLTPATLGLPGACKISAVRYEITALGDPGSGVIYRQTRAVGDLAQDVCPVGITKRHQCDLTEYPSGTTHANNARVAVVRVAAGNGPRVFIKFFANVTLVQ
jgi:hypothetical protein